MTDNTTPRRARPRAAAPAATAPQSKPARAPRTPRISREVAPVVDPVQPKPAAPKRTRAEAKLEMSAVIDTPAVTDAVEDSVPPDRKVRRTSQQRHLRAVRSHDTAATPPPPPPPPPSAPEGMGVHGKRLWRDVLAKFEFRPDELVVLASACFAEERVHGIREELAQMQILVRGSMGQMVTNPLLTEIRAHENHVAMLLAKLKLKDVESGATQGRSEGARTAAKARWATPHGAPS